MIILTFRASDGLRLGVKTSKGVLDIVAAQQALGLSPIPEHPMAFLEEGLAILPTLREITERSLNAFDSAHDWFQDESAIEFRPCVPRPGKIICVGLNYRRHAAETGKQAPENPVLFPKFHNAVHAPNAAVALPPIAEQVDYEAELAVVIGRRAKYVAQEEALNYVMGYCNANDISERRLQYLTGQWLIGKNLDGFLPLGPYLVTADEVGDPQDLQVRSWLNGELRQDANTADMIFPVAQLISFISQIFTLEPGDVISTGTPEGVIAGTKDKSWMKPGDEIVIEVEKLGRLVNRIVADAGRE